MASRYFDHTLVDMHLRLLPLTDFDFKLRAANGNDRAGSAKFKRRSATRVFVDGSPYAPQQQLEITTVARRGLLHRQSRVRADQHLTTVGELQQKFPATRFENRTRGERFADRGSRRGLAGQAHMDLALPLGNRCPREWRVCRNGRWLLSRCPTVHRRKHDHENCGVNASTQFHCSSSLNRTRLLANVLENMYPILVHYWPLLCLRAARRCA